MDTVCEAKMAIAVGKLVGLGVIHRFNSVEDQAAQVKLVKNENLIAAAALGIKDYEERLQALYEAEVNIIVLDVAHGHCKAMGECLKFIKRNYPSIDVLVGNIATKGAAEYFFHKGADGIKVGIGPGAMCTTRIMTGAGVPQITAIMDVYEYLQGRIPLCGDGGIKVPGDMTKAVGAGADSVMVGSIVSGTDESPGEIIDRNGEKFKVYRGMASYDAAIKKQQLDGKKTKEVISVEGEKTLVPYKGPVELVIKKFLGGLASGMTYVGATTIESIRGKVDFIEISPQGLGESVAHGVRTQPQKTLNEFVK
jgi:IMP dehydrogenase